MSEDEVLVNFYAEFMPEWVPACSQKYPGVSRRSLTGTL